MHAPARCRTILDMNEFAEQIRRLENMIRIGTIAEVDYRRAMCRVKSGNLLTNWLPWNSGRAGEDRSWSPPTVGEQVMVLSPGGDPARAVVTTSIYSTKHPAPDDKPETDHMRYRDGAIIEYDSTRHHLRISLPAGATTEIVADAGIDVKGDMRVDGDVIARGISLIEHKHSDVKAGADVSGPPV